ncbi:glycoside hydrolase family 2 TIM barrel-domain containing protein [Spongiimicrobium sp. 3-5]|uniref:glycoside hydrolase family 2 TIM barrel-domain containing protein n=1 Tax=Spongiimicrobium sp. 3-5 TaxID=3332596 RepID=UPI00398010EF
MIRIFWICCFCFLLSCKENTQKKDLKGEFAEETGPAKVEVRQEGDKYQLYVDNEPFYIKGAGLEFGDIKTLAMHNANSFRTWRTENGERSAKEVLDEAHENGLMVSMGIEVGRERHGFDYDDPVAVANQLAEIKKQVVALKDHPALLIWGIGNELNLHYTNPKVWDAVNDISKMIHSLDPNHPTTTSLAGIEQQEITYIQERCTDLDILAVQMYGDLPDLPRLIEEFGWEGPYMVTEWGATGHWEVPQTSWGAPIEDNSTVKAANYLKRYKKGIEADSLQCIGSYVFLWGNKQERTPTWYGIFLEDGQETESVDVMHYVWNGEWPSNRTPAIKTFVLDGKVPQDNIYLVAGKEYNATIEIMDYENDTLTFTWEIMAESTDLKHGGDEEKRPDAIAGAIVSQQDNSVTVRAPDNGAYRLFVYVNDGQNHSATANIPFMVN